MAAVNDDAERTPTAPASAGETNSRFPGTGDDRVDRALAKLPDPAVHRQDPSAGQAHDADQSEPASGIGLPDPGLLDAHIADVTAVHRELQQRLSDLSG